MRGFLLGLLLGALGGAGGLHLAREQPWKSSASAAPEVDAGAEVAEAAAGDQRRKRGKRRPRRARSGGGDAIPELSAADRQLQWKGPKIALPDRDMDFESGGEGRPLNASEINQVIESRSGKVIECIKQARGDAPLEARITLEMLVDGSGRVTRTRMQAPRYLFANGFFACAGNAAAAMKFPATGAHTVVTAPFTLTH